MIKRPSRWVTGSGEEVSADIVFKTLGEHTQQGGKVFVGTDSQLKSDACIFATAICLHGETGPHKGRYYFKRFRTEREPYAKLKVRIMEEVNHSIEIGMKIIECFPTADVEIHVDIGSTAKSKTRNLVTTMTRWAKGAGFSCKIKPNAWASASIADKHTK